MNQLRDAAMWVVKNYEEWYDAPDPQGAAYDTLWKSIDALRTALEEQSFEEQLPQPRLIETPDYTGYYLSDIHDALTPEKRRTFTDWFAGQGGVFHNGRRLVYADDWERFLALSRKELVAEEERVEAEAADAEGRC